MVDKAKLAAHAIEVAQGYVGIDRQTDKPQICKFLALFGLDFADEDGVPYSYCAAGMSYAFCKAYADLAGIVYTPDNSVGVFKQVRLQIDASVFRTSASCGAIARDAIQHGTWLENSASDHVDIEPGWLVMYNWSGREDPEHVGIVIAADDQLHTVEFNTGDRNNANGGAVQLRTRGYDCVVGFVRTY